MVVSGAEVQPRQSERHLPVAAGDAIGGTGALWSVPVTGGEPKLFFRNAVPATTSSKATCAFVRPIGDGFVGPRLLLATADGVRTLVKAVGGVFEPKMSPDRRSIAYSDSGSIYVVDVSTPLDAWLRGSTNDTLIVAPAR
jgi:hypothetical protein